jgi:hypothetical protein
VVCDASSRPKHLFVLVVVAAKISINQLVSEKEYGKKNLHEARDARFIMFRASVRPGLVLVLVVAAAEISINKCS